MKTILLFVLLALASVHADADERGRGDNWRGLPFSSTV
jgi:hypothetical protein